MTREDIRYGEYIAILREELIPALGCTEPISVALAAANARDALGVMPEKLDVQVSNNIVKNVKSVVVPNTGGMKGIEAAARWPARRTGSWRSSAVWMMRAGKRCGASWRKRR